MLDTYPPHSPMLTSQNSLSTSHFTPSLTMSHPQLFAPHMRTLHTFLPTMIILSANLGLTPTVTRLWLTEFYTPTDAEWEACRRQGI